MSRRALLRMLPAAGATALLATPAHAHLVNSGLGPFYDGMGHLVMTPEDLLPVLAMALLAGQRGAGAARGALFALPATWLLAGLAGRAYPIGVSGAVLAAATFFILGALVAAAAPLRAAWVVALALVVGAVHGYLNGAALSQARLGTLGLVGIVSAIFALCALLSAAVIGARPGWARIAVRVAGSWVAAIGLLLLGWAIRGSGAWRG